MGDFIGFTFGGIHSSELGITRISGGDRYEEELHPEIKDRTAEVPGVNGEYYFGSDFGPKTFDIEIAFDSLTEDQFKKLRQIFGSREIKPLIFDERPYKTYMAKLESPIKLSYICFDEYVKTPSDNGQEGIRWVVENGNRVRETIYPYIKSEKPGRIYKGEGQMTFICRFPFAKSTFKVLPSSGDLYYEDSESWAVSSGILSAAEYNGIDVYNNGTITVYNPGDVETGFQLYLPGHDTIGAVKLIYDTQQLLLNAITLQPGDNGILIDSNNNLIIGVSSINDGVCVTTKNLYNNFIEAGTFFKIPPGPSTSTISIVNGAGAQIFYDYLYF